MTDNEIIKALECIAREEIKCAECAYGEYCYPVCQNLAGGDALNLINFQNAKIESLEVSLQAMRNAANGFKSAYERAEGARNTAIQDFAERLNEKASFRHPLKFVLNEEIDNIVKEMIGETNESIQQEDC